MEDQSKQINEILQNLQQLRGQVKQLEDTMQRMDKQQIKIVGNFDGTNAPVTVNGIRRKIATTAP